MPLNTGHESSTIELDSTGSISANFAIASHGQGLETTLAQIIAVLQRKPVGSYISDPGGKESFRAKAIEEICESLSIDNGHTLPYNPNPNQSERLHKNLGEILQFKIRYL